MIVSYDIGEYKLLIYPVDHSIFKIGLVNKTFDKNNFKQSLTVDYSEEITYKVIDSEDTLCILTKSTIVELNKETGLLVFKDIASNVLLEEIQQLTSPGAKVSSVKFKRDSKEKFYGGGERGYSFTIEGTYYNYNRHCYGTREGDPRIKQMSICIPWIISSKGYGILFDDFSTSRITIDKQISYETDSPFLLSYFFINGGGICETVQLYNKLTGKQPLPPLWILGYNSSRFANKSEETTLDIINTIKEAGFPLDSVMIDLFWQGSVEEMGSHNWSKNFSRHTELINILKQYNIHTTVLISPYITAEGSAKDNYDFCVTNKLFCQNSGGNTDNIKTWYSKKPTGLLDITNPDTQQWLFYKYINILQDDIDGFWCDLGEPEYHPNSCEHYNGLKSWQYHNRYSNDWVSIINNVFKIVYPEKRPVLLTRSGTTGLQRYSTFTWSGDVYKGWSGLQCQLKMMLSSALSGIGYHSSDIGGFAQPSNRKTMPELYIRWLELGLFSPVMRTHSQQFAEPFYYPEQHDIILNIIKERYRWLPYNYSCAYVNSLFGVPVCKPLNFFKTASKYNNISDEYFWGDNVLVAPVLSRGKTSRKVIFPEGNWIDYYNPENVYKGETTQEVEAPLGRIPVFVKESSFLVLSSQDVQNTSEYDSSKLDVHLYYGLQEATYILYDDDFTGVNNIAENKFNAVKFTAINKKNCLSIQISDLTCNGLQRELNLYIHRIKNISDVYKNGEKISFTHDQGTLQVNFLHNNKTTISIL